MPAISLKLSEQLLTTSGECASALQLSRAEYTRQALERMNRATRAHLRAQRLRAASRRVRQESIRINAEFDAIEGDIDARAR
ncbi:MAG: hypothetical protein OXN96_17835 [Bryobacterales bacterium]|nr:hypothetical protein [Bryobacterales bacterium]MDE0620457.1 hypothetical protein [Bryobacterales bacterium]